MSRRQKALQTKEAFGQVYEGYLYQCDDCRAVFAIPGKHIEPECCPVCGCCESITEDIENTIIISDGSTFPDC